MISSQIGTDGIATLTFEPAFKRWTKSREQDLGKKLQAIVTNKQVRGILVNFAQAENLGWIEGPAYDELLALKEPEQVLNYIHRTQALFRVLEHCGKPVVITISELLVGRGLELALACHYRVMVEDPKILIGFPDIKFGLIPGAGGVQRLSRKIGLQAAVNFLLSGQLAGANTALQMGLVDKVVTQGEMLVVAKEWLLSKPVAMQPWDKKGFQLPGGAVDSEQNQSFWALTNANLRRLTWGNFVGKDLLLSSIYEGLQVPLLRAEQIEAEYFVRSVLNPGFKEAVKTLVYVKHHADRLAKKPSGLGEKPVQTLGIVGAGMMGAGIALVAAERKIKVVLLDVDQGRADEGKAYTATYYDRFIKQNRATVEQKRAVLDCIETTTDYSDLKACDLVIEAVSEDRAIKGEVTTKAEAVLGKEAFLASNTSTLPITSLALPLTNQERFIGLHFFSPTERMPLLEIIVGEKTSKETIALALDFAKQMGKTPIVVNDGRGFFTSRVFEKYVLEGMAMLQEGINPALIENAARLAGMPVGPLALADEVSLSLIQKILKQTREDLGKKYEAHEAEAVVEKMVEEFNRLGRKKGQGFYDYPADRKKQLWSELTKHYPLAKEQPDVEFLKYRLLFIQSLEAVKCIEENIIADPVDADLGSILGLGFPAFTGGVISYLQQLGYAKSLEICEELQKRWGKRFNAPKLLKEWSGNSR